MDFIDLNGENIREEHICCAISDKKCAEGYREKKEWLSREFEGGYRFYRLNERAKVFIEYGPGERAWAPVRAEGFGHINCFWVSGKYKGRGLGKELLGHAEEEARRLGFKGLTTLAGRRKFHFMSDGKWLQRQGFRPADETASGFLLLVKKWDEGAEEPAFMPQVREGRCPGGEGLRAYYSRRCPYAPFHAEESLRESAAKRGIPLELVPLTSGEEARLSPAPSSIFSLFYKGRFLTTDLSVCLDSRFDRFWEKAGLGAV